MLTLTEAAEAVIQIMKYLDDHREDTSEDVQAMIKDLDIIIGVEGT